MEVILEAILPRFLEDLEFLLGMQKTASEKSRVREVWTKVGTRIILRLKLIIGSSNKEVW